MSRAWLRAHSAAVLKCMHDGCDCRATFGRRRDRVAKRCTAHKKSEDVLKLRMSRVEIRGDWEELVDNKTGQTYYYNERLDKIVFEKPKRWVRLVAAQFDRAGKGKRS